MSSQHSDFERNSTLSKTLHVMCLCPSGWNSKHSRSINTSWKVFMKQCSKWKFLFQTAETKRMMTYYWHSALIRSLFKVCQMNKTCSQSVRPVQPDGMSLIALFHTVVWQIVCSHRYRLLRHSKERQRLDGLNNLNYSPLVSRRTLYTNITVTLSRKLAPVANYWHRQNWTVEYPGIKVLWD